MFCHILRSSHVVHRFAHRHPLHPGQCVLVVPFVSRAEHAKCGAKTKNALINRVASDPELSHEKAAKIILPPVVIPKDLFKKNRHNLTSVDGVGGAVEKCQKILSLNSNDNRLNLKFLK